MYMESASILIVDDEPKHARLLREILNIAGYSVLTCSNGDKAVEKIVLEQPDLVIIDIVLIGDMDGYQLTERIREFSDLPIVMLTARNREADMLRGFDSGADDYITKPFSAQELLARIKAILGRTMTKAAKSNDGVIIAGGLTIDQLRRQVTLYDISCDRRWRPFVVGLKVAIGKKHHDIIPLITGNIAHRIRSRYGISVQIHRLGPPRHQNLSIHPQAGKVIVELVGDRPQFLHDLGRRAGPTVSVDGHLEYHPRNQQQRRQQRHCHQQLDNRKRLVLFSIPHIFLAVS